MLPLKFDQRNKIIFSHGALSQILSGIFLKFSRNACVFIFLYRLLFLPCLILYLPQAIWHMLRRGGYGRGFLQRFGIFLKIPRCPEGRKRIWLHGVSVGEVHVLEPLVRHLAATGFYDLVITATTSTGLAVARKIYANCGTVTAFPIDFWLFSRLTWKRIAPQILLHADGELWPEHLHQARRHGVPFFIVNARLSPRGYRRYKKVKVFARKFFARAEKIFVASPETARQLDSIGICEKKIFDVGNLKCDRPPQTPLRENERIKLLEELSLTENDSHDSTFPILLGCSTWPGEEELLIDVLFQLRTADRRWKLVLIPRHGERRCELRKLLTSKQLTSHFRTDTRKNAGTADVAVVDTAGELSHFIGIGTVALLGKTLPPNHGAQSPLDAVAAGVPLVCGPNVENFRDILDALCACGAVAREKDREHVAEKLSELCGNLNLRAKMADAGTDWLRQNVGAAERIYAHIAAV
ncbi:MAG: hypothetical protein LBC42_03015 [Puniceicoccales bacterium]|jgi:3-deoxy-D-manno-octulosonic-acid transferase|nr:hypothetical protein [Puniceicoccales bacterium]